MVAATKFLQFHSTNRATDRAKIPTVTSYKTELALVADPTRESLSEALVKIGASKDEAAFALVYSHFAGRIKSFLIGKGMDEDTAEELMQEIMLTVWRRAESYNPAKAAASTWIFTIARNRRIDHLRGSWRVEVELDDVMLEHSLDGESIQPNVEDETLLEQETEKLFIAMDKLPREQKQVMHLSYFRGQSHGDIAQWLGLPVGTVKSRIRLALQSIRGNMRVAENTDSGDGDKSNEESLFNS